MNLMDFSNRSDYLELYDIKITPSEAIVFLNIINRIDYKELLVGEAQILNNITTQLEKISHE